VLIDTPIRALGCVDCRRLTEQVLAADESAWYADNRRQDDYEVHAETQSIILVFFSGWPTVSVAHGQGWDVFGHLATPIMEELVAKHYPPGGMAEWYCASSWRVYCRVAASRDTATRIPPSRLHTVSTCRS